MLRTTDSSEQRESNPANRSQPSAPDTTDPSDCACTHGCREELRVLRARCKLAENHAELLEIKCEKERRAISTYRSRLDKWRESSQAIIRDTNRRREEVQRQSFHPEAPPHTHNHRRLRSHPQYPSRVGQVHFGPVKVTRLPTEDSDASQRTETTRQNTLLNQYNSQLPADTNYHAATSNSYSGTGSRSEPHILDADDDDVTPVSDTDASGGNTNYRVMSPSLPSELELRRRQALAESEPEEDSEHSGEQDETLEKLVHRGTNPTESTSPTARALRGHQQTPAGAASSSLGGDDVNRTANKPFANQDQGHTTTKRNQDFSLPSDHSSPPMFDFSDHNDMDHGRRNTNALKSPTVADSESDDERDDFHPPPRPQFVPKAPETHEKEALIVESTPTPQELQGVSSRSHVRQMLAAGAIKDKQFVEDELMVQDLSRHGHRQHNDGWITSTKPKYSRQSIHPRQEDYDFLTEDASGAGPSVRGPIFNETERRKDKRRHMHGSDCACCRRVRIHFLAFAFFYLHNISLHKTDSIYLFSTRLSSSIR